VAAFVQANYSLGPRNNFSTFVFPLLLNKGVVYLKQRKQKNVNFNLGCFLIYIKRKEANRK
jgi:hypothetical protein